TLSGFWFKSFTEVRQEEATKRIGEPKTNEEKQGVLVTKKIIKKRVKKFIRPQSDRKITVKKNWRRPRVLTLVVRRKFKGVTLMPNIGPTVREIAHNVSTMKRKAIVERAAQLDVVVQTSWPVRSQEDR
ncbi:hypothetical protein GIB67_020113, partial [Kingdonia uniflora]